MINDKNREQMHIVVENMNSSILKKLEYKSDKQTLLVEFNTGSSYLYDGVPSTEFLSILGADSQGKEFNKLKNKYEYEKIC
jgi:hypothetical protein